MGLDQKLKEAVSLFNRREYFHCHEVLEELWHQAEDSDKAFYEGLIRLATGFHLRFHRGVPQGAINLLTQGLMRLEDYRPARYGIDVARLYQDIDSHVEDLKASNQTQPGFFERWWVPRIYVAD